MTPLRGWRNTLLGGALSHGWLAVGYMKTPAARAGGVVFCRVPRALPWAALGHPVGARGRSAGRALRYIFSRPCFAGPGLLVVDGGTTARGIGAAPPPFLSPNRAHRRPTHCYPPEQPRDNMRGL